MNHDQQLSELRRQEDQLFQKEREIVREKRNLEDELNRFEGYSSDAHRYLWDAFESYPSSRKISNSYLEELDELAIQKRKVEDDLNDIYHERKKLMIEKECDDGN